MAPRAPDIQDRDRIAVAEVCVVASAGMPSTSGTLANPSVQLG